MTFPDRLTGQGQLSATHIPYRAPANGHQDDIVRHIPARNRRRLKVEYDADLEPGVCRGLANLIAQRRHQYALKIALMNTGHLEIVPYGSLRSGRIDSSPQKGLRG